MAPIQLIEGMTKKTKMTEAGQIVGHSVRILGSGRKTFTKHGFSEAVWLAAINLECEAAELVSGVQQEDGATLLFLGKTDRDSGLAVAVIETVRGV